MFTGNSNPGNFNPKTRAIKTLPRDVWSPFPTISHPLPVVRKFARKTVSSREREREFSFQDFRCNLFFTYVSLAFPTSYRFQWFGMRGPIKETAFVSVFGSDNLPGNLFPITYRPLFCWQVSRNIVLRQTGRGRGCFLCVTFLLKRGSTSSCARWERFGGKNNSFQFNRLTPPLSRTVTLCRRSWRRRALSSADLIRNAAKFLREFWRGGQLAVPRG